MNYYDLTRAYWDFAFEHPDKVRTTHAAIFMFAVEHCNRLGWKKVFGFPTSMAKEATGISSYNTYIAAFRDLARWGFIIIHEESKNQYSSNKIELSIPKSALSKNDKALDKALTKHHTKQSESTSESTIQSIDSIIRPLYKSTNLQGEETFLEIDVSAANENENSTPGGAELELDPEVFHRVPIFGKIKIHQQQIGKLWDQEADVITRRIAQRLKKWLSAKRGRGTFDDNDLYDLYVQIWGSDNWHMTRNPSLATLDKNFDAIVNSLSAGVTASKNNKPNYSADSLSAAIESQLKL